MKHRQIISILMISNDIMPKLQLFMLTSNNCFQKLFREVSNKQNYKYFRVLGFYRVPPTIGRIFNMTSDLREKADTELEKTFYISPGKISTLK